MRKLLFILTIAFIPFLIGSCEDDSNDGPDLTKDITGDYSGSLMLTNDNGTNVLNNLTVRITKIDNSTIQIEPLNQTDTHSFKAKLSEASDGIGMKIDEQEVLGGSLTGYNEEYPDIHGGLTTEETDDQPFFYSLKVDLSGYIEYRIFLGSPIE